MLQGVKRKQTLKLLSDDRVEKIHEASLRILARTGLRIDSGDAAKRLIRNGAAKHPTKKGVITFPRPMVEEAIRHIPRYGTYCARDPKNDMKFDGETTYAHCEGGNPNIVDLETGEIRMATYKDVCETTRVMDALENCHSVSNFVVATDVPPQALVVRSMEAMMKNTSKCLSGYALKTDQVDSLVRMWACVSGGVEELRKRPLFTLYGSPSSPLTYDAHVCDVMIKGAEYGIPVDIVPCPICGGTAPVTLAGGLAQQNAEILGGVMLIQTVDTKLPISYSGRLSVMDLRTGQNVWGVPEMALASAATAQIAHRYNMIADVYGVTTDVQAWDTQVGLERMQAALIPALAGADNLSGMGGAWGAASSFEMLVIDNEIYADVFRIMRGFEVDEEHLAVDIIDKVGHMNNFLAQPHTMKHFRAGELRVSPLYDKRSGEKVGKEGFRALHAKAKEHVKKILREHQPTPLDKDVERELDRVVKEESKKLLAKA
ncbi:MAG: trimethylamine methyltransferase family protein [Thermoplasmata archaeon]